MSIWSTLKNNILRYPCVNKELHEPLILLLHLQMLFNFTVQLAATIFPSLATTPKGFCYVHSVRGNQRVQRGQALPPACFWGVKAEPVIPLLGFLWVCPRESWSEAQWKRGTLISWPLEMLLDQQNLLLWHKNKVGYHESGLKADVFNKLHLRSAQIKHFASLFHF